MTRDEALRLLGLGEDATEAEVKIAYRELAQILHPDKYNNNERLSERANEQLKMVNEAREVLLGKKGSKGKRGSSGKGASSGSGYGTSKVDRATAYRAKLAGIIAAITQLTAQLHAEMARRRIGFYLIGGGAVALALGNVPAIRILAALAAPALIWGVLQLYSTLSSIKILKQHIKLLQRSRKLYEKELEGL